MPLKRALAMISAVVMISLATGLAPVRADTDPGLGCGVMRYPDGTLIVGGAKLTWGAQHGSARVHATVWVSPPSWPAPAATIHYAWKVGTTYVSFGHHYYSIPWSADGKPLSAKVQIHMPCGDTFTRYYNFGVVRPPA